MSAQSSQLSFPDDAARFSGRTLVVLGAGYVGEAVCRGGLARGMEVFALTRNPERAAALVAWGVRAVVAALAGDGWHAQSARRRRTLCSIVSVPAEAG